MEERNNEVKPIISRPVLWIVMAAACGVMALLMMAAAFSEPPEIRARDFVWILVALSMMLIPALGLGIFGCRAQIIGDSKGLRWRRLGRWKSVSWAEVTDFYFLRSARKPFCEVETSIGKFQFSVGADSHGQALADLIAQRATNAKMQEWQLKGLRAVDTDPQTFRYGGGENWFFGGVYSVLFGLWLSVPFYSLIARSDSVRESLLVLEQMPVAGTVVGFIGSFVFFFVFPLCGFVFFLNWARENWQRRDETIEVTPETISWKNGVERITARWDELNEFHVMQRPLNHSLYWLETEQGGFAFSHIMRNWGLLWRLINHYAPQLKLRNPVSEFNALGSESLKWSGGKVGVGARIFHYRTRFNRALAWLITAICLLGCLMPFLVMLNEPENPGREFGIVLFLLALIPTILAWFNYYRSSLRVSDEGIEQVSVWGCKLIPWEDVSELRLEGEAPWRVRSDKSKIVMRFFIPADLGELNDEIKRRAVNARKVNVEKGVQAA